MGLPDKYSVPSVDRALTIMELLADSRRGYSISEISRKLNLPKSSIHLLISTLDQRGYLQKNAISGKYRFGLKLISLSRTAIENLNIREEARPFLQLLMEQTGLTVHLAVLERNDVVIIDKVEGPGMFRLATWIGGRLDMNSSGVGKVLLAFLPENEVAAHLEANRLVKHNENTIASPSRLKRELARIRSLGYAFEDEEGEIGFRCVGAPIFDNENRVAAAISVAGTTSQIRLDLSDKLGRMVKTAAANISTHLWNSQDELSR